MDTEVDEYQERLLLHGTRMNDPQLVNAMFRNIIARLWLPDCSFIFAGSSLIGGCTEPGNADPAAGDWPAVVP